MRVAVVGAGAMGTLLGHGFCKGGHDVTVLDLPARVAELQSTGRLIVIREDGSESAVIPSLITTDYRNAGTHDVVVMATKSQDLPAIAGVVAKLADDKSTIVPIQNGIPWWYLHGLVTDFGVTQIRCLDPDALLEDLIDPSQVVGCVAYPAATMESDGRVRHVEGKNLPIGELDGSLTKRTLQIASLFEDAGFKSRVIDDIRSEIWLKALGALSINPVSALTRATIEDICTFTPTRELIAQMMREAQGLAMELGVTFRHTIERRIEGAEAVGQHKTSMLQDVENRRPLELEGLMLAIMELADITGRKIPTIRSIYACAALLSESLRSIERPTLG